MYGTTLPSLFILPGFIPKQLFTFKTSALYGTPTKHCLDRTGGVVVAGEPLTRLTGWHDRTRLELLVLLYKRCLHGDDKRRQEKQAWRLTRVRTCFVPLLETRDKRFNSHANVLA